MADGESVAEALVANGYAVFEGRKRSLSAAKSETHVPLENLDTEKTPIVRCVESSIL